MSELQKASAKELAAQTGELEIIAVPGGLQKKIDGVHLGRQTDAEGKTVYVDDVVAPVPEAGIGFNVAQNSLGFTGILALPLEGYKVEAGNLDAESGAVTWTDNNHTTGKLMVAFDEGEKFLYETPVLDWNSTNFGNPGVRVGIIGVTGPDSSIRTFALAAEFDGEPDDWNVHGGIIEVDLAQSQIDGSRAPAIEA